MKFFQLMCAWCQQRIKGEECKEEEVSHGICLACFKKHDPELYVLYQKQQEEEQNETSN